SAVQLGFILGTLIFALLSISDRYSPSRVFFFCATLAALSNLSILWAPNLGSLLVLRSLTGICLAGIYPVGMKIAADHHRKSLGTALGFLIGALVLGTAFPHLLKSITGLFNWEDVIIGTSLLAVLGGLSILLLVPDGPYRKPGSKIDLSTVFTIFRNKDFRSAAFGYFGHMWELYGFWAFVPVILITYQQSHPEVHLDISATSFLIIGSGSLACVAGGFAAKRWGSYNTARTALMLSLLCCLFSPILFTLPLNWFLAIVFAWSMAVIADSPQFSTLIAHSAPAESKGTALTMVNCLGFSITIISLMAISWLREQVAPENLYLFLSPGPLLGLLAMRK
ncbi:MAG TPA: MFS transporter, partial [Sphingobacteriaceae bacterium]